MKQIVVISGKGGTGKTTLAASFCALAERPLIVDCDVDASDLHLLLHPVLGAHREFFGGKTAVIDPALCTRCGRCREVCRFAAIPESFKVQEFSCEGCALCARVCPAGAVQLKERLSGRWFVSETKYGPMVHAELDPGAENSGKLISVIKKEAGRLAEAAGNPWMIVDGPPGTGCPVMASLSGASLVVIVTEPTFSAISDMKRVWETAASFSLPCAVVVNKRDINPENTLAIEKFCEQYKIALAGTLPFDRDVQAAIAAGVPLPEYNSGALSAAVGAIWRRVTELC